MREYIPDVWVVVEFKHDSGNITKILAGWYGGFANGDSWQLSSGIESIKLVDDVYVMPNSSGSVYKCHKSNYGTSGYTANVYDSFVIGAGDKIRMLKLEEIYATPMKVE